MLVVDIAVERSVIASLKSCTEPSGSVVFVPCFPFLFGTTCGVKCSRCFCSDHLFSLEIDLDAAAQ